MSNYDVFQHNFRLNLNNPMHLKLHQQLMNVNLDIYKSKNNYMVKKMYAGIFGEEKEVSVFEDESKERISEEEIKEIERRITQSVMSEVLKVLLGIVAGNSQSNNWIQPERSSFQKEVDDNVASAALGYFEE